VRITPDIVLATDEVGRFDVFTMVVSSLRITAVSALYIFSMVVLFLHTSHGIQSFFQTLGINNDRTLPKFNLMGKFIAGVFLLGFGAIPFLILTGILAK
ncbi:MAG: succinate dehydrogenase/fumarate reductase cytochrome b subunit, partial [bacterium]|nr:succinate dehydrogenase/fumarate reductase cytochrome b subunit [bacterium]